MPEEPKLIPQVCSLYEAVIRTLSGNAFDAQSGLGGRLLYAGELNAKSSLLLYASNVAGAASIVASGDPLVQRTALRDGVSDFLVTSLEEALRILKNEVRKRESVSVCVAMKSDRLSSEMVERGVLPDLLPPSAWRNDSPENDPSNRDVFLKKGALEVAYAEPPTLGEFVFWSVEPYSARWLAQLDQCALAVIPEIDFIRRRWLRLAPRYLGRAAQREHGAHFNGEELTQFRIAARDIFDKEASVPTELADLKLHIESAR